MFPLQMARIGIAFRYLSSRALSRHKSEPPEELGRSAIYFPLAGFIFGTGFMVSYFFLSHVVDVQWSCLVVIGLMIWFFKRRLCEDSTRFLDTWNMGPGLGRNVVRVLLIFFLMMLKFLALTHLGEGWILEMLVLAPTLSCWSFVYLVYSINLSNIENELVYARFVRVREFWGATLFATLTSGIFMELEGFFLLMLISVWAAIIERWILFKKKIPPKFVLGVIIEFNEVFVLLGLIALRKGFAFSATKGIWV